MLSGASPVTCGNSDNQLLNCSGRERRTCDITHARIRHKLQASRWERHVVSEATITACFQWTAANLEAVLAFPVPFFILGPQQTLTFSSQIRTKANTRSTIWSRLQYASREARHDFVKAYIHRGYTTLKRFGTSCSSEVRNCNTTPPRASYFAKQWQQRHLHRPLMRVRF